MAKTTINIEVLVRASITVDEGQMRLEDAAFMRSRLPFGLDTGELKTDDVAQHFASEIEEAMSLHEPDDWCFSTDAYQVSLYGNEPSIVSIVRE